MIRTARRAGRPTAAVSLVLAAGLAFSGASPAAARTLGTPTTTPTTGSEAAAAAVAIPAPDFEPSGYGTEVEPTIDGFLLPDLTGIQDASGLRYEYRLDETGPWRTEGTVPVTRFGGPLVAPASAGPHLLSVRIVGTVGGAPVVGAASAPEPVRSSGSSRPYTPEVVVAGTTVTFRWDVREALNGNLPEDSQIFYELDGGGEFVFTDAVGSVTVDRGYDSSVGFALTYGIVPDLWATAEAVGTTGSAPGSRPLTSTPPPAILGQAVYGATLSVRTGLWQPAPVRLSYQWYADGKALLGATGPTFLVDANRIGARITVAVRGARDGYASVERISAPTPRVPQPVVVAGTPVITGIAAVGRTVTARPGSWRPASVQLSYAWLRDGRPIPGATTSAYAITGADRGHVLSVRVTGTLPSYPAAQTRTSAGRTVG
ncbi:hypothetical protein CMsap09_00355 [Clavibacter michiganensis]|uniref:Uncharacterized protein n=1 Tax=Clavibacter michiganensis TaxID=28447 RepID=A0A251XPB2_9MICO|nr:hypothetical protein CMsap09_00355 [Clavibacter michiganensis]